MELSKVSKFEDFKGRRISHDLRTTVCDANRGFHLERPRLEAEADYVNRLRRLHECLGIDTRITPDEFCQEIGRLLALIQGNRQIANIANGVFLPVVLPKLVTEDLGAELELYLAGVGNSYAKIFSDRKFYNYRKGELDGKVSIVGGSRHKQLIRRMKQEPAIGIHFPNPLQGFSVEADREQMATLPEGFILSGLDTAIAMVMYPDILVRDCHTPGLDLATFSGRSVGYSFCFLAYACALFFTFRGSLTKANGRSSGGLLFLG